MGDKADTVGAMWRWCVIVIGRGAYNHGRRDSGGRLNLGVGGGRRGSGVVGAICVVVVVPSS